VGALPRSRLEGRQRARLRDETMIDDEE